MIEGVANIWMPVRDVERAAGFYRDVLGLTVVKEDVGWVEFDANGVRGALNGREPKGAGSGGPVLTFETAALEETVSDLTRRGVEFTAGISEHDWGRVTTFRDTEGNEIQLYEPPRS